MIVPKKHFQLRHCENIFSFRATLKCLSIGTPKIINFPFVSNGKVMIFMCPNIQEKKRQTEEKEADRRRGGKTISELTGMDFASSTRAAENRSRWKGIVAPKTFQGYGIE